MIKHECPDACATTTEELRGVLDDGWGDQGCDTFEAAIREWERRLVEFLQPSERTHVSGINSTRRRRINRGNENEQHVGVSEPDLEVG